MGALASIASIPLASGNSWLITPNVGLTIWTLVVFAVSLYILNKLAFPRIRDALDARRRNISESIDAAEQMRKDADQLLGEYRERLSEARVQADEILQRARQTAEPVARACRFRKQRNDGERGHRDQSGEQDQT